MVSSAFAVPAALRVLMVASRALQGVPVRPDRRSAPLVGNRHLMVRCRVAWPNPGWTVGRRAWWQEFHFAGREDRGPAGTSGTVPMQRSRSTRRRLSAADSRPPSGGKLLQRRSTAGDLGRPGRSPKSHARRSGSEPERRRRASCQRVTSVSARSRSETPAPDTARHSPPCRHSPRSRAAPRCRPLCWLPA